MSNVCGGGEATLVCRMRGCVGLVVGDSSSSSTMELTLGAEGRLNGRGGMEVGKSNSGLPVGRGGGLGRPPRWSFSCLYTFGCL